MLDLVKLIRSTYQKGSILNASHLYSKVPLHDLFEF